jgi:N-acetyl-anhydromuramyl-L-alanine amidase AmpD
MLRLVSMRTIGALATALVFTACAAPSEDATGGRREATGSLASALSSSAALSGVPRDLLLAIAKVEDGLTVPAQRLTVDASNEVPAAGPLQLRRGKLDTLRRGAELTGMSEIELRRDGDLALHAGALVLAEIGARTGARAGDLASWGDAVREMSGFADEARRERYAQQVFATLARGGAFDARDGETVVLPPHDLPPSLTIDVSGALRPLAGQAEYAGAEWIPTSCSGKCVAGRGSDTVRFIVIHDTEGGWNASVATLQNDPGKSVHYIVGVDGRVAQFVTEDTTAWHTGNSVYNARSVGIEHVGYSTKPFAEEEYAASAKLVDYLAKKYSVARDRAHVIGHDQIPNGKKIPKDSPPCSDAPVTCTESGEYGGANQHSDPGVWEWSTYMARFGGAAKCNDAPATLTCAEDKSKAFRCASGTFELQTCDGEGGCVAGDPKADAVCHLAPKSTPPPPPAPPPATTAPAPTPEEAPAAADSGGCALAPPTTDMTSGAGLLVTVVASAWAARRRRPRR